MQEEDMHDIKKLKDELAEKRAEQRVATSAVAEAERALQLGYDENSGLIGHVLAYPLRRGYPAKVINARILVHRVRENYNGMLIAYGKRIIANGTVGLVLGETEVSKANDLGPYVAPAK